MFIDLTDEDCLIVGGGQVALRKVQVLLDFGARVFVVAKEISQEIQDLASENRNLSYSIRLFSPEDLDNRRLVVVATSDGELNSEISSLCNERRIPVNVVDDQKKCSFIFPSYVKEKNLVGAFSSGGKSPVLTQYLKQNEKEILTPRLGEINEVLGQYRTDIIERIPQEQERKKAFEKLLDYLLHCDEIPSEKEIKEVLYG
jgi:uroporphyrin-III C-methyltransferase/precorrin-2 dehydrogenase/sirohydrochlorin ferrochelatase/precorrin-2 dehydrogenase/sirohydrochlorin ferrochelatase